MRISFRTMFLSGKHKIGRANISKVLQGLSTVPLHIIDMPRHLEDDAILAAGIFGYTIVDKGHGSKEAPTIQANHTWSLHLTPDSPLRIPPEENSNI